MHVKDKELSGYAVEKGLYAVEVGLYMVEKGLYALELQGSIKL